MIPGGQSRARTCHYVRLSSKSPMEDSRNPWGPSDLKETPLGHLQALLDDSRTTQTHMRTLWTLPDSTGTSPDHPSGSLELLGPSWELPDPSRDSRDHPGDPLDTPKIPLGHLQTLLDQSKHPLDPPGDKLDAPNSSRTSPHSSARLQGRIGGLSAIYGGKV